MSKLFRSWLIERDVSGKGEISGVICWRVHELILVVDDIDGQAMKVAPKRTRKRDDVERRDAKTWLVADAGIYECSV